MRGKRRTFSHCAALCFSNDGTNNKKRGVLFNVAGMGPAPKPPERRARNKSGNRGAEFRVIEIEPTTQPGLPETMNWPQETVNWWEQWAQSPLSNDFTVTDWSFLMDTAILHAQLWGNGDLTVMAELRIRVAKFGATPEDRARLRIQFAQADQAEDKNARSRVTTSRERLKATKLRVV